MANYSNLIAAIQATIYNNGQNLITGSALQGVLIDMVQELGQSGAVFGGVVDRDFVPATSDSNIFYVAAVPGTYSGFNQSVSVGEVAIFYYDGTDWAKATVTSAEVEVTTTSQTGVNLATISVGGQSYQIRAEKKDTTPTVGSSYAVTSNGVASAIATAVNNINNALALKADTTYVDNQLALKADATTVAGKADKGIEIIAGTGLQGGGDLSENRTLALDSATQASLAKADSALQPQPAVAGDLAQMTADGGIEDSNIAASDVHDLIANVNTFDHIEVASGGKITFTPITLSQNGDELEIEALPAATVLNQNTGGYPFTFGSTEGAIRVGLSIQQVCFRADDNTWIYGPAGATGDYTNYNPKKVKIKYTGGNIEVYTNDVLRTTYTGQKTATISGIGSQTMSSFGLWYGKIWKFNYTHNGTTTALIDLPGFSYNSGVTIVYNTELGRVPKLEAEMATVLPAGFPKFAVRSTSSQVKVYTHLHGSIYAWFGINHIVSASDTFYEDYWRIGHLTDNTAVSGMATYADGVFTDMAGNPIPLTLAENEFAIQFWAGDFTGGAHGDERIDLEAGCYVVFIVDGQEYSIADLIALGDIDCSSFGYREKSALYTRYEDTGTHDVIAYHTKRTNFCAGGYSTRNYIEMTTALTAITTYSGLFCVGMHFVDNAVNDAGTVFPVSHPTTTVQIAGFGNKASREVKMYKDNASCVMDSKVIGGNVAAFNSAGVSIQAWDRQYDCKYYSSMPANTALAATSVFEFEADIIFDYREQ